MDNFSVDELNEILTIQDDSDVEITSRLFHQVNASDEAVYFVETMTDLVGLIYVTDTGIQDGENALSRYAMSTASLQPRDVLSAAQEAAAAVAAESAAN